MNELTHGSPAAVVLGTLRAHIDRLAVEIDELDTDIEESRQLVLISQCCMIVPFLEICVDKVERHGQTLQEPLDFLERLRALKSAKLQETQQSLFELANSYDRGDCIRTFANECIGC